VSDPNASQADYWNAARHWVSDADGHDDMSGPLGRLAIDALDLAGGMRVLDIGCGTGATTREIARRVGPSGDVLGADISGLLLGVARTRSAELTNVSFVEADVQTHPFDEGTFDAAFSRMGVMFFADPVAAFANVRRALRGGGRLAFVCWRSPADNEWVSVPGAAARPWVDLVAGVDTAPGPFALADGAYLERVLRGAGFERIAIEDVRRPILVGGHGDLDTAMRFLSASRVGKQVLEDASDPDAAFAAIRKALGAYVTAEGVEMTAAVWLVTARR